MRLAADRIHGVRTGDITATLIRQRRRRIGRSWVVRAPGVHTGKCVAIRKVEDRRRVDYDAVTTEGEPPVYYDRVQITLSERVEITGVRGAELAAVPDPDVTAAGFDNRDEFVDYWTAELDACPTTTVWVVHFVLADDSPRFLGRSPDYVSSEVRAIDDRDETGATLQAVDAPVLARYVEENRVKSERLAARRRELHEMRTLHARLAAIEPLAPDLGLERQMARVRDAIKALEKEAQRRAA